MNTYTVQAQLGTRFEDVRVTARTPAEAIAKARAALKGTALDHRFTNYVL
jgi:hypothetical protein